MKIQPFYFSNRYIKRQTNTLVFNCEHKTVEIKSKSRRAFFSLRGVRERWRASFPPRFTGTEREHRGRPTGKAGHDTLPGSEELRASSCMRYGVGIVKETLRTDKYNVTQHLCNHPHTWRNDLLPLTWQYDSHARIPVHSLMKLNPSPLYIMNEGKGTKTEDSSSHRGSVEVALR